MIMKKMKMKMKMKAKAKAKSHMKRKVPKRMKMRMKIKTIMGTIVMNTWNIEETMKCLRANLEWMLGFL